MLIGRNLPGFYRLYNEAFIDGPLSHRSPEDTCHSATAPGVHFLHIGKIFGHFVAAIACKKVCELVRIRMPPQEGGFVIRSVLGMPIERENDQTKANSDNSAHLDWVLELLRYGKDVNDSQLAVAPKAP